MQGAEAEMPVLLYGLRDELARNGRTEMRGRRLERGLAFGVRCVLALAPSREDALPDALRLGLFDGGQRAHCVSVVVVIGIPSV
jgi:hypothetical protein